VFRIHKDAVGPKLMRDFFSRDQLSGTFEEHGEDLEGLPVHLDADALAPQLSGGSVGFKDAETIAPGWLKFSHGLSCLGISVREREFNSNLPGNVQLLVN